MTIEVVGHWDNTERRVVVDKQRDVTEYTAPCGCRFTDDLAEPPHDECSQLAELMGKLPGRGGSMDPFSIMRAFNLITEHRKQAFKQRREV